MKYKQRINTIDTRVNYFVTSDLHFFHKNILKFNADTRPFRDVQDMTEKLIAEWNEKVRPCDVVFHLGDFSFGKWALTEAVLNRLNGTIIWVLGNHDKVIRDNITENVFDYLEVMVNGTKVVMSHYPMTAWNQQGRGSVMLHGHCHGHFQGQGRIQDAGYDALGSMVRLDMLVERILEREIYTPDNH